MEVQFLSIILAYLDYKSAYIDFREKVSFTATRVREILREIKKNYDISGVVLLSTCNRTELYISSSDIDNIDAAEILCEAAGLKDDRIISLFNIKYNNEAILHLMEVACGLQSMVLCEDQIITQVKNAALVAREEKTSDSILETLFRLGATAAKKAKTLVKIKAVPNSVAESAMDSLAKKYNLNNKKVLVIGNGETGRLCCQKLINLGAEVTITLRKYKHGETIVPYGCSTISYDERAKILSKVDVVVSATSSPHYTITLDMLDKLDKKPQYFIDLALPRDIEPVIWNMEGIYCYNLDYICGDATEINADEISQIKEIISYYFIQFEKWNTFHKGAKLIKSIKKSTFLKVSNCIDNSDISYEDCDLIEQTVNKTVDIILYSLKNELSYEMLCQLQNKINFNMETTKIGILK